MLILGLLPSVGIKVLAQAFSGKFCDIFKKTFFNGTPPVKASGSI